MKNQIAVAGATGALGNRVVRALLARGASVQALVRDTGDCDKVDALREAGATIVALDEVVTDGRPLEGTECVVSALAGLHETIVESQSALLDAALRARVPRFIPSDFGADFTKLVAGENRNFDLRREFHLRLDAAPIRATSILNGMFADLLSMPQSPFLDVAAGRVNYWGSSDQPYDFTTMDDTAAFTAAAAMDETAPRVLRIAGDQVDADGMAALASAAGGRPFVAFRLGSVDELAARIGEARRTDPKAETTVFAPFQALQYVHNMASGRAKLDALDNDRYAGLTWTRVEVLIREASMTARSKSSAS